ncbi:hypothetical protein [Streptomyces sp. HD]|uniref:hypothetical protein n=1 Tax=Streptomyces sp. HD TaxID=3020892 RepID=UPI00233149A5|nr:hypothetical protein [Streptomyces sp. HD]MDC0767273.1 hypothetical protein [Streptomyces sp. HD]
MTAFLALVAVVAFMAKAGLPWWVVVAVALLMAGFVAGSRGPGRNTRSSAAPGPAPQPMWSSVDRGSPVRPDPVDEFVPHPEEQLASVSSPQPPEHAGR